jgi:hypothetical protein
MGVGGVRFIYSFFPPSKRHVCLQQESQAHVPRGPCRSHVMNGCEIICEARCQRLRASVLMGAVTFVHPPPLPEQARSLRAGVDMGMQVLQWQRSELSHN